MELSDVAALVGAASAGGLLVLTLRQHFTSTTLDKIKDHHEAIAQLDDRIDSLRDELHTRYVPGDAVDRHLTEMREELRASRNEQRDVADAIHKRLGGLSRELSQLVGALRAAGNEPHGADR